MRLTRDGAARELIMARWGLVPFWADDLSIGNRLINARCETVHTARVFREAYTRRRCLVPTDGFVEWQKQGKLRQPFLIRRKDQAPFAFAGLWQRWRPPGADDAVVRSCTIITCPVNDLVAPIHDRIPVILAPEAHARWLDLKEAVQPEIPVGDFFRVQARLQPVVDADASHRQNLPEE